MRTHARSLPAAATALLLAASTATMPGCARPDERDSTRAGQAVTVVVTYNPDTKKAELLDPDPEKKITLRQHKDWAVWYSAAGLVYVEGWSPELPFDSPPKHDKEKKILKSGPARKNGTFIYKAKLVLTGDTDDHGIPIDPRIVIHP